MGLFTKLFDRSHFPYELKGRWYKLTVFADPDTGYFSVLRSDIPIFDEDAPAFGYSTSDNSIFVVNGYVLDFTYMTLSGAVYGGAMTCGNEINPDMGVISSITADGLRDVIFDLYLYVVKPKGAPNAGPDDNG